MRKNSSRARGKMLAAVACALVIPLTFSGCMPYKEIKDESIVEGMGIDFGLNGYDLTFQIYNPQKSSDSGSGDSKKSGSSEVTILQSNGATLFDAIRNATLQNGRKLYFSNVRAYVVSQEVCEKNFSKVLDFLERNHEIRPTGHMYITKDKAADILTYKKDDEIVPAVNLELMSRENVQTSKIEDVQLFDIFKNEATGITDSTVAAVSIKTNDSGIKIMQMDGTAVFHNDNLAGYLDGTETRGNLWVTGKAKGGVLVLALPQGGNVSMELLTSSSKMKLSGDSKNPVMKVDITLSTNLIEVQSRSEYTINDSFINSLKKIETKKVTDEARDAVDKALVSYNSDIFGFGLKIFEDKPEIWRTMEKSWRENAKNLKVEITVNPSIYHTGLTTQTVFARNVPMQNLKLFT